MNRIIVLIFCVFFTNWSSLFETSVKETVMFALWRFTSPANWGTCLLTYWARHSTRPCLVGGLITFIAKYQWWWIGTWPGTILGSIVWSTCYTAFTPCWPLAHATIHYRKKIIQSHITLCNIVPHRHPDTYNICKSQLLMLFMHVCAHSSSRWCVRHSMTTKIMKLNNFQNWLVKIILFWIKIYLQE